MNILVTIHDPRAPAVPMIIDFGIAKATQGRLTDQTLFTAFEQSLGTPAYMRGDLDWLVMKTRETDRARRYDTANGLAADPQRDLNPEPVLACPRSRLFELRRTDVFAQAGERCLRDCAVAPASLWSRQSR